VCTAPRTLAVAARKSFQKWGGDPLRQQGAAITPRPSLQKGGPQL